ncbi:MAG: hypothetical protein ACRDQW_10925 [Haloechinothrix sp.]
MSMRLPEHWIWDFWFATDGDVVHVFFLHAPKSPVTVSAGGDVSIDWPG